MQVGDGDPGEVCGRLETRTWSKEDGSCFLGTTYPETKLSRIKAMASIILSGILVDVGRYRTYDTWADAIGCSKGLPMMPKLEYTPQNLASLIHH